MQKSQQLAPLTPDKKSKTANIFRLFSRSQKLDAQQKQQQLEQVGERPKSFNEKQDKKEDGKHQRSKSHGGRYLSMTPKKKDQQGTNKDNAQNTGGSNTPESSTRQHHMMGCFSRPSALSFDSEDEVVQDPKVGAPEGLVGLYNLGNTCFINTAVQCLRCTPGLVNVMIPDLEQVFASIQESQQEKQDSGHEFDEADSSTQYQQQQLQIKVGLQGGCDQREQGSLMQPVQTDFQYNEHQIQEQNKSVVQPSVECEDYKEQNMQPVIEADKGRQVGGQHGIEAEEQGNIKQSAVDQNQQQYQDQAHQSCQVQQEENIKSEQSQEKNEDLDKKEQSEANPEQQPQPRRPLFTWVIPFDKEERQKEAEVYRDKKLFDITKLLLVQLVKGEKQSAVKPADLYKSLYYSTLFNDFCDRGQHDCSEFFKLFLQQIHQDLNRVPRNSDACECQEEVQSAGHESEPSMPVGAVTVAQDGDQESEGNRGLCQEGGQVEDTQIECVEQVEESELAKAERELNEFLVREQSLISDMFMGQLQCVTICNKCNNRSTKYEPFWELNVPLVAGSKGGISGWFQSRIPSSIEDTLRAFVSEEVVDGKEAVKCDKCNQKTACTRYFRIHKFPTIVIITMKRFKWIEGDTYTKIKLPISAPLVGLDLQPYRSEECDKDTAAVYDLYALCNHSGDSNVTGHYTATCKIQENGKEEWVELNDDKVAYIERNKVVTPAAYMFFYKLRQETPKS
eukprot:TRINITY_DN20769_c0_g1_i2.p1 TRINITY_DN20769_c0_g1~~TRINITY_DN20769_c0_g1_i2.p1  ORF type:complete len:795 (+),score=80.09 TRINITY_DN20769_c0_g1_i2:188-2386(+)